MNITDEQRQRLTKYLNECWHDIEDKGPFNSTCKKCGASFGAIHASDWNPQSFNRTFTTDTDMMTLFRKLVDSCKYIDFNKFFSAERVSLEYLFYEPERFCLMVDEWLEREMNKEKLKKEKIIKDFIGNLINNQETLTPEFSKIVDEHFWELVNDTVKQERGYENK